MGFSHQPNIITDGLVTALDASDKVSYGGSGTTWTDLTATGNDGTLTNGTSFETGSLVGNNGTLVFDGSNDYVQIGQIDCSTYTISMWFNLDSLPSGDNFFVMIRQGFNPVNYGIYINASGEIHTYGVSSTANHFTNTSVAVGTGAWTNLTFTKDWTTSKDEIYINGELKYGPTSFSAGSYEFNNSSQSYNFTDIARNVTNNNSFVDGKITNCFIYSKILNSQQILHNYNVLKGRFGL